MSVKRVCQSIVLVAILSASFTSTGGVVAWSGCASYVTVQWGDTLSGISAACGTTVEAIRTANPGLGWWPYAGQVLRIPAGYASASGYYAAPPGGSTYVVRRGDALGEIAARDGFPLADILAVNPQIWNANLIYPGQVINLPAYVRLPPPVNNPPSYYPPAYYPPAYSPPAAYPTMSYPPPYASPTPYPLPTDFPNSGGLKVTYKLGLLVRTGPGLGYSEIQSPLVSAVKNTTWRYRKDSVTVDRQGLVWVEVGLGHLVNGYSTGWILVKDGLGKYFTDPNIDP